MWIFTNFWFGILVALSDLFVFGVACGADESSLVELWSYLSGSGNGTRDGGELTNQTCLEVTDPIKRVSKYKEKVCYFPTLSIL